MKNLMGAALAAAVAGAANVGLGATYTNEVAQGVTQTFAQMETALGITLAEGDTIVKKGPGILQADSSHMNKHTLTLKGEDLSAKFRARHKLTIKTTFTIAASEDGIVGTPALRAARLGVAKDGNSLYVRPMPGFFLFVH